MARIMKKKYPCIVMHNLAILPGMIIHFDINSPQAVKAVEKAMIKDHRIFVVADKSTDEKKGTSALYNTGCLCLIKQIIKLPNNIVRVLVEGEIRACLAQIKTEEYLEAGVRCEEPVDDWYLGDDPRPVNPEYFAGKIKSQKTQNAGAEIDEAEENAALQDAAANIEASISLLKDSIAQLKNFNPKLYAFINKQIDEAETLSALIDCLGGNIPMEFNDRQKLLETFSVYDRCMNMLTILERESQVLGIKSKIAREIKTRVDKNQREYVLREQLRVIKEELGEGSSATDEEKYKQQAEKLEAAQEVKDKILKEIDRYSRLHDGSSESEVSRSYIETLLSMPWDKASVDNKDLDHAKQILDEDHYGLTKVKERVLEFLAVRNLTSKGESPIICLVGPPGTGKTSIAKSVAKALSKKYIRICLGGVRDEAEIRGHRRTYVGAMPGRIAMALKNSGVKNPLILLDEIDKMSNDYKGDPSSAMLEVLDAEQNCRFMDHYLDFPIDLSEVLFIATANSAADIPRPLLDRMEIIEVSSYTENEKIHIAKEHLLDKQLEANGLKKSQLKIYDTLWPIIVNGYTREAGVRGLERKIAEICRKSARMIYQDEMKTVRVNKTNISDFLGKIKYERELKNEQDEIGIVRGLAWTSVGGDTLSIEVNVMPGKGEIILTGQLGDVMKESARAGMSYIRSIAAEHKIAAAFFEKHDFHIHIPEGSVPKDGPSAGITMATALFSAITKKKVSRLVAMTGEITLRGRVLAIGGLKEKLLAAKNAGIKKVLVPKKNLKDVEEIDDEILEGLKIVYVENMDEVLKEALI